MKFSPFVIAQASHRLRRSVQALLMAALAWHGSLGHAGNPRLWGYVAWWMPLEAKAQAMADFERLIFFQIEVAPDGALDERHGWPEEWTGLNKAAANHKVALDLGITLLETAVFKQVFGSSAATHRLLSDALALASQPGVSGIHLDVEVSVRDGVSPQAIQRFRAFVVSLSRMLQQQSPARELSVFLPFGDLGAIYDAETLTHVKYTVLQGYDAHFQDSTQAGPVAPLKGKDFLTWEKMLAAADRLGLARQKMVMSFPLYGYEWTVPSCLPRGESMGRAEATTLLPIDATLLPLLQINISGRVAQHGAKVETDSGSLYYTYVNDQGVCAVGWFEDSWTLRFKSEWIEKQNLRGLAFFPLGYDQGVLVNLQKQRWRP